MKEHTVEIYMKVILPDNENICTWVQEHVFYKEEVSLGEANYVQSKTVEEGVWILK